MGLCQQRLDGWTSLNSRLGQKERWFARVPSKRQSVLKTSIKILPTEFFRCCTLRCLLSPGVRGLSIPSSLKTGSSNSSDKTYPQRLCFLLSFSTPDGCVIRYHTSLSLALTEGSFFTIFCWCLPYCRGHRCLFIQHYDQQEKLSLVRAGFCS